MIETSRIISQEPGHWWSDQLNNRDAITGYYPLGEEIWSQLDGKVDAFVQVVGTAHSIHGVTRSLQEHKSNIHVTAVEPAESAVLSGKPTGSHKIEGIGIGFIPPLWEPDKVNDILTVTTEEAKTMSRRLRARKGCSLALPQEPTLSLQSAWGKGWDQKRPWSRSWWTQDCGT